MRRVVLGSTVTQRQLVSSIAGPTAAVEAGGAVGGDGIGEQASMRGGG
jgi:hypothetical protein